MAKEQGDMLAEEGLGEEVLVEEGQVEVEVEEPKLKRTRGLPLWLREQGDMQAGEGQSAREEVTERRRSATCVCKGCSAEDCKV